MDPDVVQVQADVRPKWKLHALPLLFGLTIAVGIVGSVHGYFIDRLLVEPAWPSTVRSIGTAAIVVLALSLFAYPVAERTQPPRIARYVAWPAALWMGACFYLLLGLWASDALMALLASTSTYTGGVAASRVQAELVLGTTLLLLAIGIPNALRGPRLREVKLRLPRWPAALDGYRIVQLSDVHIGPTLDRVFAQRIVDLALEARPDLVVVTGDLVDGPVRLLEDEVAPFSLLTARHGVYFVTGNHDHYSNAHQWTRKVTELGMKPLRNSRVTLGDVASNAAFELAGVDDPTGKREGGRGDDVQTTLKGAPRHRPVVLLAHDPRSFDSASSRGVDLQLSGHTHGGQMWPFEWLVRLSTRFVAGHYQLGGSQLYVSCGTGYWGPPVRLGTQSEVTVLVIERAP